MSRALDKGTVLALRQGNPSAAFEAISRALTQSAGTVIEALLEIELLPKSHVLEPGKFLLQEDTALAISKAPLVQAFFMARKMFQAHRSGDGASLSTSDLLAVTSVILVMDPEHLTAANARKSFILSETDHELRLELLRKDKHFVDSLLTSRLHRHTKSPTLWSHRRWSTKMARSLSPHAQPDVEEDLKHIVMVAAERHPKNYYAWCHARWLTDLIDEGLRSEVLQNLVAATKSWCFRNHTDTSGWSFLSFLLGKVDTTVTSGIFEETLRLAISLRWTNESTWVFLRTLAGSGALADDALLLFEGSVEFLRGKIGSQGDRRVVEQTKRWYETYRRHP